MKLYYKSEFDKIIYVLYIEDVLYLQERRLKFVKLSLYVVIELL